MSKYTTELRYICETITGQEESQNGMHINDIITRAAPLIFNFDFPIFDDEYKLPLEIKILRHYYTREICEETVALWKLRLEDKLNIIMPYYNQLYKSALLDFNPLYDVDYTRTYTRDNNGTSEDTSTKDTTNTITNSITEGTKNTATQTNSQNYKEDAQHTESIIHSGGTNVSTKDTLQSQVNAEKSDKENHGEKTTQNIGSNTTASTENTESGSKSSWGWNLFSDTPQGGVDGFGAGADGGNTGDFDTQYLTNATKTNGEDTTNSTGTANSTTTNNQDLSEQKTINSNNETTETSLKVDTANKDEQTKVNNNTRANNTDTKSITDNNTTTTTNQQTHNMSADNETTINESGKNKNVTQNLEDYTEKVQGKQSSGNYADMILKFRETFLNIDKMIITELQPLFFGLW